MLIDRRDVDFLLSWLEVSDLLSRGCFEMHDMEGVSAILDLAEQVAEKELAPTLRLSDLVEPKLHEDGRVSLLPEVRHAVLTMADAGLFSTVFDLNYDGLQLPHVVHQCALGILMSGNLAAASFALLTVANARLLTTYASPEQIQAFALPQIAGRAMGTMCMSEPHAGSSLGDIRTRAVVDGNDELGRRFRITGNKMWISGGDQDLPGNIIHLVLAKVPDENGATPAGTRGISLFIVPRTLPDGQENDVAVAGLNHKMGYRGIPNCALNFGEGKHCPDGAAGAIGWLVGDLCQGLPQMFHMMNEARVSVGLAAAMLGCRGYQMSLDYARQRAQGRTSGAVSTPQVPIIEHADVRRMLLLQKAYSQGALALVLYSARLLDDEKSAVDEAARWEARDLLGLLTPITKTWPSEWIQMSLHNALQIHGGAGYTRDFDIELLYRDNRLNPIHEGTTGIQGLDLVRRKIRKDRGRTFKSLAERIRLTIAKAGGYQDLAQVALRVAEALRDISGAVDALLAESDELKALSHSNSFLLALGHLIVGWLWLDQASTALAASKTDNSGFDKVFLDGRVRACQYFSEYELPMIRAWLDPIFANSSVIIECEIDEF